MADKPAVVLVHGFWGNAGAAKRGGKVLFAFDERQ